MHVWKMGAERGRSKGGKDEKKKEAHRARWPRRHGHRRQHIGYQGTDSVMFTTELRVRKRRLRSAEGDVARPTATRAHTRQPWARQRQPPQNCAAGHEHTPRPREKARLHAPKHAAPAQALRTMPPKHWQKSAQAGPPGHDSTYQQHTPYSQPTHRPTNKKSRKNCKPPLKPTQRRRPRGGRW